MKEIDVTKYEGTKMCVVFCQLQDETTHQDPNQNPEEGNFKIKCLHGNGKVLEGKYLEVTGPNGSFKVPPSAYERIYPNDGTDLLKDSQYFVMVKLDHKLEM